MAQCLMGTPLVVPVKSGFDRALGTFKALKPLLPDALFFEAPKEPFDQAILVRGIGDEALLVQTGVPTHLAKATTL